MKEQSEALRLADELERDKWHVPAVVMQAAADELRRLHEAHDWQYRMAGERLRRVEKLEAQRDALLEALRKHVYLHDKDCVCEDCAAIDKAEGENHAKNL